MSEFAYGIALPIGYARASAYYRTDPGHIERLPADIGAVVSVNARF